MSIMIKILSKKLKILLIIYRLKIVFLYIYYNKASSILGLMSIRFIDKKALNKIPISKN